MSAAAVVVAGGSGERLPGDVPKQLRDLGGVPILAWSVLAFQRHPSVSHVVTVLPKEMLVDPPGWLEGVAVEGGATRAESVVRGVAVVPDGFDVVLVHDGVRPFVPDDLIERTVAAAMTGPAVPVTPVADTIKRVDGAGVVVETPPRSNLRAAQTPQGFPLDLLRHLHETSTPGAEVTDDGVLCERSGVVVQTIEGDAMNLKITDSKDLSYARWLVETGVIERPSME